MKTQNSKKKNNNPGNGLWPVFCLFVFFLRVLDLCLISYYEFLIFIFFSHQQTLG